MPKTAMIGAGNARWYVGPSTAIVNINAPKVSEVTTLTEISDDMFDYEGFEFTQGFIPRPRLSTAKVTKTKGEVELADSALMLYTYKGGLAENPLKATLANGEELVVVQCLGGATGATGLNNSQKLAIGDLVNVWDCIGAFQGDKGKPSDHVTWTAPMQVNDGAQNVEVVS